MRPSGEKIRSGENIRDRGANMRSAGAVLLMVFMAGNTAGKGGGRASGDRADLVLHAPY
jgi:hypothetical protein